MKTWIKLSATSMACILAAGMVGAQSSNNQSNSSQADSTQTTADGQADTDMSSALSGISPADMMCNDLNALDGEMVSGALYYIAGYQEGRTKTQSSSESAERNAATSKPSAKPSSSAAEDVGKDKRDGGNDSNIAQTAETGGDSTAADSSGKASSAANTAGEDADKTAAQDSGGASGQSADSSDDKAQSTSQTTTQTSGDQGGTTDSSKSDESNQMRGFATISVDDVISACKDAPERRVSDIMDEHQTSDKTTSATQ